MQIYGEIFAMQPLKSHFCMGECKLAAFLQNTFSEEHLWKAASGHLHYNMKHIHIQHNFLSIYQYKVILLKIKISI